MNTGNIIRENRGHIAILYLNHPPVNSIDYATLDALEKAIDDISSDKEVRVLVITGRGEKGFSGGFDVTDVDHGEQMEAMGNLLFTRIENLRIPVIAALNGFALGAGCELALSCHFRMIEDKPKSSIGLPEIKLGMFPLWGGTQRLPRLVGRSKALEIILLGQKLSPSDALEIGLVNRISEPGKGLDDALSFAEQLAFAPPLAVRSVLKAMAIGYNEGIGEGLRTELEEFKRIKHSKDIQEGFLAFYEKRTPVFTGQ